MATKQTPVNTMELLQARLSKISEQVIVLENLAEAGDRPLSPEELKQIADYRAEFKDVEAQIAAKESSLEMAAKIATPLRRVTQPEPEPTNSNGGGDDVPQRQRVTGGDRPGVTRGSGGFISVGDFASAARKMAQGGRGDPRILNAPSSFGQEAVGADGGFAVPPDFRTEIMKQVMGEDSLFARTDQQVTSSNALTLPIDTNTPWDTSTGVQAAWVGESGTISGSKPSLKQLETKAHKLAALVPVTEELLADVPALTGYLNSKIADKFTSAINQAIVNGSGVGQPMGMMNAGCKVVVAKKGGQGAGTIIMENITKMWSRMYGKLRSNAVWLSNQDIEPQLQALVAPGPLFPAYLPPGGLSASPYSTLLGRPILPLEACATVGTEGDLILCDPSQYLTVIKAGGMRSDVSLHLYFDSDTMAFRFILRLGGQSYWPAPIARANGGNSLSPIVTLNSDRT